MNGFFLTSCASVVHPFLKRLELLEHLERLERAPRGDLCRRARSLR
jgi:hypothetical protein